MCEMRDTAQSAQDGGIFAGSIPGAADGEAEEVYVGASGG